MKPTRALVLSGGGAKGAFQAGVLSTLDSNYSIFTGISVGALNAAYLAQFKDTRQGILGLINMWSRTETKDVYKKWFGGHLAALWKSSVYNSAPLRKMVESHISPERIRSSGNNLTVGAVEVPSGRYGEWHETSKDIIEGVLASSAFPAMLTPIEIGGRTYLDGGLRVVTPIASAINLGATHIDVVMCSHKSIKESFPKEPNTLKIAATSLEVLMSEIVNKDLKVAHLYNRLAAAGIGGSKREISIRVIRPPRALGDSLDFNREKMGQEMQLGVLAGLNGWKYLKNHLEEI